MAAPDLAASMADCAICSGVTGTAGLRPGVSADPVTAHEIMTLRCMPPPCPRHCFAKAYSEDRAEAQRFRPQRGDAGGEIGGDRRQSYTTAARCLAGRHDGLQVTQYLHKSCVRRANQLLKRSGLPLIVHCAKPSQRPSLERIRSVTR